MYWYILLALTTMKPLKECNFYDKITHTPKESDKIKIIQDILEERGKYV